MIFKLFKHYKSSETKGSILDFRDLIQVKLHNEQFNTLLDDPEYVLGAVHKLSPADILESLFYGQIHKS